MRNEEIEDLMGALDEREATILKLMEENEGLRLRLIDVQMELAEVKAENYLLWKRI